MSNSLKLSTALPGDDEINGLDALADDLVADPSRMICAVIICDVKDVRYITDVEAHVPTLRFRRGEAWPLSENPEAVRVAMIQRSEARLGKTPLPFGEVTLKHADDRPDPDDCDHTEFIIERDHLEDVPEGQFRETCLRCGFYRYQPVADLPDALARIDAQAEPSLFAGDAGDAEPAPVRTDDVPEVWVYGDDDPKPANVVDLAAAAVLRAVEGDEQ